MSSGMRNALPLPTFYLITSWESGHAMASPLRQFSESVPLASEAGSLNTALLNLTGALQEGSGPAAS